MKVAAFVIGLLGGFTAFGVSIFEEGVAAVGGAFGAHGAGGIAGLGALAWVCAVAAIVGPCFVLGGKARAGAIITLAAGTVGFVSASAFWTPAGVLLILSGIFGLLCGSPKRRSRFEREIAAGERAARRRERVQPVDGPTHAAGGPLDRP